MKLTFPGMWGVLSGLSGEHSHADLNKVHRRLRPGAMGHLKPRTDSWRLGEGVKGNRNRQEGTTQGDQIPHFQPLQTVWFTPGSLKLILLGQCSSPSPFKSAPSSCHVPLAPGGPHRPPRPESDARHHLCLVLPFSAWSLCLTPLCRRLPPPPPAPGLSRILFPPVRSTTSAPGSRGSNRFPAATMSCLWSAPSEVCSL